MCGILGAIAYDPAFSGIASLLWRGAKRLTHRGQEGWGMVTDHAFFHTTQGVYKYTGRLWDGLDRSAPVTLGGSAGLLQTLYTTTGKTSDRAARLRRIQPFIAYLGGDKEKPVAFVFNGTLMNWRELGAECVQAGYQKEIFNDTAAIAALVEMAESASLEDALRDEILPRLQWSFSLIFLPLYRRELIVARGMHGFMPLALGIREGEFMVAASEDWVFARGGLNCRTVGEVPRGTMMVLDPAHSPPLSEPIEWKHERVPARYCLLHFIYFNHPGSTFCGRSVKEVQERAGEALARRYPVDHAEVITWVNDSGRAAGQAYGRAMAERTGRWMFDGLVIYRERSADRAFIEPEEELRRAMVEGKHDMDRYAVAGKVVVVVDDSIVRATTMQWIVSLLFGAGAKEVHVRIASPPVKAPCRYGIDTPTFGELAWNYCGEEKERVRGVIGATSLEYLLVEDNITAACGGRAHYPCVLTTNSFCTECFTGRDAVAP